MLAHSVPKYGRGEADADLVRTALLDLSHGFGFAVDPAKKLIRPYLARLPDRV
jgi:hypothetical protein